MFCWKDANKQSIIGKTASLNSSFLICDKLNAWKIDVCCFVCVGIIGQVVHRFSLLPSTCLMCVKFCKYSFSIMCPRNVHCLFIPIQYNCYKYPIMLKQVSQYNQNYSKYEGTQVQNITKTNYFYFINNCQIIYIATF